MSRRIVIEFLGKDKSLGSSVADADRKTSKLGATLSRVGKAAAIGLGAGVVLGAKALAGMTKNAMEDEAAQRKLAIALKNSVGATDSQVASVEKWISAQGRALGVTDDELRPAFQRLVEATGSVDEAQRQMSIAMDVSAGTGKSLKTVSEALMKANNGTTASLSKLGLKTKDAQGNTLSLDDALKKMSSTFAGQAAAKANTLEGKMGRLRLIFDETKETIGAKLIPILTVMADWFLNKGLPAIEAFGGWIRTNLGPIFTKLGDVIAKVTGGMDGDVGENMGAVLDTFRSIVSIIRSLWARFGGFLTVFTTGTFRNLFTIIGGALKIIQGVFKVFAALLRGDWKGVWEGIKLILRGAWDVIRGIVKQALNAVTTLMRVGWSAAKAVVGAAWDGIRSLVSRGVMSVVDGIRSIPGKVRALAGSFRAAGSWVISALLNGLSKAGSFVGNFASGVWSAVKSMLNSAISKINAALDFTIGIPGPDIHVNIPNIPYLARGTSSHRGGLAIVGEEGPELVKLPRGSKVTPHGQSMGQLRGAGGGTVKLEVNFNGLVTDPRAVGRELIRVLRDYERASGRPLGLEFG